MNGAPGSLFQGLTALRGSGASTHPRSPGGGPLALGLFRGGCSGMFRSAPPRAEWGRGCGDLVALTAQTSLPGPWAGSHTVGTARPHPQAWACRCRYWFRRQRVQSRGRALWASPCVNMCLPSPSPPGPGGRPPAMGPAVLGSGPHRRRRRPQTERGAPVRAAPAEPILEAAGLPLPSFQVCLRPRPQPRGRAG